MVPDYSVFAMKENLQAILAVCFITLLHKYFLPLYVI